MTIEGIDLSEHIAEARHVNVLFEDALAANTPDFSTPETAILTRKKLEQDNPWGNATALDVPVEERDVDGVSVRVIRPAGDVAVSAAYLHMHGGGWVVGSAKASDVVNAATATDAGVAVVSVDYRLAPEHPFPAAVEDCCTVGRWLGAHAASELGTDRLLIGGESAGATLAVQVLLRLRDEGLDMSPFAGANLVYGAYDISHTPSTRRDARDAAGLAQLNALVFPGRDREALRDPYISPLYADLTGMPPALFTVGELDGLRDDSLFMDALWRAFGNESTLDVYPESVHGFDVFPTKMGALARSRMHAFLRSRAVAAV